MRKCCLSVYFFAEQLPSRAFRKFSKFKGFLLHNSTVVSSCLPEKFWKIFPLSFGRKATLVEFTGSSLRDSKGKGSISFSQRGRSELFPVAVQYSCVVFACWHLSGLGQPPYIRGRIASYTLILWLALIALNSSVVLCQYLRSTIMW